MKNRLKEIRWRKGWSQAELARRAGVSKSTICALENGDTEHASIDVVFKLHKALKTDVWEIFYED